MKALDGEYFKEKDAPKLKKYAGKEYDSLVFSSSQRGKTEKTKWAHQNTLQAFYSCKKRGKTKDFEIAVSRREGALQARAWFKLTKRDAELLSHLLKQFIDGNHPFDVVHF